MQGARIIVVYDSRSVEEKICGRVGGHDRRTNPNLAHPQRRSAAMRCECPRCATRCVGGQLTCLLRNTIVLVEGVGRLCSPIFKECVSRVPEQVALPLSIQPKKWPGSLSMKVT